MLGNIVYNIPSQPFFAYLLSQSDSFPLHQGEEFLVLIFGDVADECFFEGGGEGFGLEGEVGGGEDDGGIFLMDGMKMVGEVILLITGVLKFHKNKVLRWIKLAVIGRRNVKKGLIEKIVEKNELVSIIA